MTADEPVDTTSVAPAHGTSIEAATDSGIARGKSIVAAVRTNASSCRGAADFGIRNAENKSYYSPGAGHGGAMRMALDVPDDVGPVDRLSLAWRSGRDGSLPGQST